MATFYANGTTTSPDLWTYRLRIDETVDTAGNKSSLTVRAQVGRLQVGSYVYNSSGSVSIMANGETKSSGSFYYNLTVPRDQYVDLWSATFSVAHESDGTKTISVSSSWDNGEYHPNSASVPSTSITLTPIARTPSAPTSFTAKDGNDSVNYSYGDTVTLSWSGAGGTITGYEIQYAAADPDSSAFGAWTALKTVTGTSTTDSSRRLAGARFKYRVRAKNGSLASGWKESNTLTVRGGVRIRAGGAWRTGTVWVRAGGVWKRAKNVWRNSGGSWKRSI